MKGSDSSMVDEYKVYNKTQKVERGVQIPLWSMNTIEHEGYKDQGGEFRFLYGR